MRIVYTEDAQEDFESLTSTVQIRIAKKLQFYLTQKDPLSYATHLSGYEAYRFRIGDYRVIFDIDGDAIVIHMIRKRGEAYRDL